MFPLPEICNPGGEYDELLAIVRRDGWQVTLSNLSFIASEVFADQHLGADLMYALMFAAPLDEAEILRTMQEEDEAEEQPPKPPRHKQPTKPNRRRK